MHPLSQARDYLALVNKKAPGTFAEIMKKMPFVWLAFLVLKAGGGYDLWTFVFSLHMDYLKENDHPVYRALMNDHHMCNENYGEVSFAALGSAVQSDPHRYDVETLDRAFRFTGASGDAKRHLNEEKGKGIGRASRRHPDLALRHATTITRLREHLRGVAAKLDNEMKLKVYVVGTKGVSKSTEKGTKIGEGAKTKIATSATVYIKPKKFVDMTRYVKFAKTIKDNHAHNIAPLL